MVLGPGQLRRQTSADSGDNGMGLGRSPRGQDKAGQGSRLEVASPAASRAAISTMMDSREVSPMAMGKTMTVARPVYGGAGVARGSQEILATASSDPHM